MPRKTVLFCIVFFTTVLNIHAQDARPDSYEPDSRTTRVPLQGGAWVSRTIHTGDEDWFIFTTEAAGILTAETAGELDTLMELYDGVSMVVENDDGFDDDENYNSRIEYFVEAGVDYSMRVSGYDSNETGPYRFRVSLDPIPQEKSEPNNVMAQSYSLELESTFTAYFYPAGDEDWYRLRIPEPGTLMLYTTGFTDTVISAHDSGGNLLAEDDDSGEDGNARLHIQAQTGTVYVKVSEYDSGIGKYYLHAVLREPAKPDQFENDDTLADAKDIQIGASQKRNFINDADEDWARLVITRQGAYEIRARSDDGMLDTYLALTNKEEEILFQNDDADDSYDACVTADLAPGTYYIRVTTLNEDPLPNNTYTLSVTEAR
jgi:hypothetical protein